MERIGIAASKIAKDNLALYNYYVIVITLLVTLILFICAGAVVLVGLFLLRLLLGSFLPMITDQSWNFIFSVSLIALALLCALVTLGTILKNIKFKK